jgi:hypothetical protein
MAEPKLESVGERKAPRVPQEREIERLGSLTPVQLSFEDLSVMQRVVEIRASVLSAEEEIKELRKVLKAGKEALASALAVTASHYNNRRLAESVASKN